MKHQNKLLLSMVAICVANSVAAQQQGRIEAGQFDIIPSLNTSMSYVDNVARATDGQAKIYSWRSILSPEICLPRGPAITSLCLIASYTSLRFRRAGFREALARRAPALRAQ